MSPNGEIEDVSELLPTEDMYNEENYPNIDNLTETIAVQSHRISQPLFEYLRSTLSGHYMEIGGADSEYLMVTCPRVIAFEELVIEWSIKLLQKVGKDELFKRRSVEQDEAEMASLGHDERSEKIKTILQLNVVTKKIYAEHMKTLKVLRAILSRIKELVSLEDDDAYALACHEPVENLENGDSDEILFKRRMGMRRYLN